MSNQKDKLKSLKTSSMDRRLSIAKASLLAGTRWATASASSLFSSEEEKEKKRKKAMSEQANYLVSEIGKLKGCRVVGVAGGAEKCHYAVQELGFDACINYHDENFAEQLQQAVPNGIDIYYENVGGKVFDAVWPLLNSAARVPVCCGFAV